LYVYRHQEIEYSWRESTSSDQSTLIDLKTRAHWNKEMKSPPATRTTMTTWFHRDVLLMRRPIFGLVYSLKNAPLHIRWFISFEKQAPYYLVLYFELWKQKSKNSVTKGSPPVRKPLADFLTVFGWKLHHFKLKVDIW